MDGFTELEARLRRIMRDAVEAGQRAQRDNANHLLGEAVQRAPVETGDLRGSGDVRELADGVEVGFYGLPYAIVQHERLDFHHPRGGSAKYLEGPFVENADDYIQHVADEVRKAIT